MNTLTETCACGSTFTYVGRYASDIGAAVRSSICGHRVPWLGPDDWPNQPPPIFCNLKAGHAGLHSDGGGHWAEVPQNGPESATGAPSSTSRVSVDVEREERA